MESLCLTDIEAAADPMRQTRILWWHTSAPNMSACYKIIFAMQYIYVKMQHNLSRMLYVA